MDSGPHCGKGHLSNPCLSQSLGGDGSVSPMSVKAFAEHVLAGICDRLESFLLTKMARRTFLWRSLPVTNFGYKVRYRRQFALISASYAEFRY